MYSQEIFNNSESNNTLSSITPDAIISHAKSLIKLTEPVAHANILKRLTEKIAPIKYWELAEQAGDDKITDKHYHVITIEKILQLAEQNKWGICKHLDFIYLYNGAYWTLLDNEDLKAFLGKAAEKMGVPKYKARHHQFRESLLKQFMSTAHLPKPDHPKDVVLINLQNGTFEITPYGTKLRPFDPADFMTYQLPFPYDPEAKASLFDAYLEKCVPDQECQKVLAEYLGYVFTRNGTIKEEKVLFLYGSGANGKSVFHEVVKSVLGPENTSQFSLQDLTHENGYHRAMIANKLVNYASEISGKMDAALFKQLASGETISARLPYGKPMLLSDYAKLIFNINELPRDVEQTNAFFRRFMIVPFLVTIPEAEQDKQLHTKIIENELSGVFNWILDGLNRLLEQKQFTKCEASIQAKENYKTQSDSVKLFLEEYSLVSSPTNYQLIKDLYFSYREFCDLDGFKPVNKSTFIRRLKGLGIIIEKKNIGNVAYLEKSDAPF